MSERSHQSSEVSPCEWLPVIAPTMFGHTSCAMVVV
jgi:hypothetical protein